MAKMKFKSNVAQLSDEKSDDALVDSGATHHFVHDRAAFKTYESIDPIDVGTADGSSYVVGKGIVTIQLDVEVEVEAYHAPSFQSHILATNLLSEMYEVIFSSSINDRKACYLCKLGSLDVTDIVWETPCVNGTYNATNPIKKISKKPTVAANQVKVSHDNYARWHAIVGHVSSDRYQKLSAVAQDVPNFPRTLTDSHQCVPCLTAKMKKAPVRSSTSVPGPIEEIHYDLSGPF